MNLMIWLISLLLILAQVKAHGDHKHNNECSIDKNKDILNKIQLDSHKHVNQSHFEQIICKNLFEKLNTHECLDEIQELNNETHTHTSDDTTNRTLFDIDTKQWLYALLAVLTISVTGFVLVYLVSKLNESFKRYLTPFLVSLAVGTLCGDALLHLLPHAFIKPHDHHDSTQNSHDHSMDSLKGLSALVGIFVFFIGEKLMQIKRAKKEKRHRENELASAKYSPKLDESSASGLIKTDVNSKDANNDIKTKTNESRLMIHGNKADYLPNGNCKNGTQSASSNIDATNVNDEEDEIKFNLINNSTNSKSTHLAQNNYRHANHTHSHHTHSHLNKHLKAHHEHHKHHENEMRNIKSTAWMAVMGDGLHNFCDGLAIGAAYAISETTGFTTTIAVFCHELPHEIGNFAVLRRAGMPIKNALIFNIISSVLCFIGVICGLLIGHIESVSNFVLLFIAGTFLYISLVDMIPELAEEEENFLNFFVQTAGILVGSGIMLLIALFEDKIKNMLN